MTFKYCYICEKSVPYGHFIRHVSTHYCFSAKLQKHSRTDDSPSPQVFELPEKDSMVVRAIWEPSWSLGLLKQFVRVEKQLYGLRAWVGLPAWEIVLLNASRRAALRLMLHGDVKWNTTGRVPGCAICLHGMTNEEE